MTQVAPFRELPEHHLDGLDDEALTRYIVAARAAGREQALETALGVLVYGHWDNVLYRVLLKVPPADAEEVTSKVILSAITSVFEGSSIGELRAWLGTIVARRIADYHRGRGALPQAEPLPTEHEVDDGVWVEESSHPSAGDSLDARGALRSVLEQRSADHREVIRLHVLGPHSAAETARLVPGMTEANVHQIASRFRRDFEANLDRGRSAP